MSRGPGFAVWITGIPSSGKSTIAGQLADQLATEGLPLVVLESDEMRKILTPDATYEPDERDRFYRELVLIGAMITRNGINVVFDATANRRHYRDQARSLIPNFVEAYVFCPVEVCTLRDPKGIYQRASSGEISTVPGVQTLYEEPLNPEITVDGRDSPTRTANTILDKLKKLLYI